MSWNKAFIVVTNDNHKCISALKQSGYEIYAISNRMRIKSNLSVARIYDDRFPPEMSPWDNIQHEIISRETCDISTNTVSEFMAIYNSNIEKLTYELGPMQAGADFIWELQRYCEEAGSKRLWLYASMVSGGTVDCEFSWLLGEHIALHWIDDNDKSLRMTKQGISSSTSVPFRIGCEWMGVEYFDKDEWPGFICKSL